MMIRSKTVHSFLIFYLDHTYILNDMLMFSVCY
uniref:Uncharacterized protein n=1 Tax=Arundo donax TaxID=35708 RepID=A0A0A9HA93_ARUDO